MNVKADLPTDRSKTLMTVTLCSVVAMFEGFDLQAAGVAAPRLAPALGMTPAQMGFFFSASTFGLILGAALGGRISDRIGRKAALIVSVIIFGLLSVATAAMHSAEGLYICRFLTGFGLGGALPNLVALVTEATPKARANTSVGLLYAGFPAGGALASLITVFVHGADWQTVFLVGGIGPLLVVPALVFLLKTAAPTASEQATPKVGLLSALFGENRAKLTVILWVSFFLALLTMYLLLNWLPTLLVSRGLSRPQASIVQVAFNIVGALGSALTGMLMDRTKRPLVIVGAFGATMLAVVLMANVQPTLALCILAGALVGGTVSGTQAIMYALAPSLYPKAIRGTGLGVAVAIGRGGSAVGPLLGAALVGAGRSPSQVLMVLLPIIGLSGLGALIFVALQKAQNRAQD